MLLTSTLSVHGDWQEISKSWTKKHVTHLLAPLSSLGLVFPNFTIFVFCACCFPQWNVLRFLLTYLQSSYHTLTLSLLFFLVGLPNVTISAKPSHQPPTPGRSNDAPMHAATVPYMPVFICVFITLPGGCSFAGLKISPLLLELHYPYHLPLDIYLENPSGIS